jgi:hypothetical protein
MSFTDAVWDELVGSIAEAFRLDTSERERLGQSTTARLIGALPFIAGCPKPERVALSHLSIYVLASRGRARKIFDHSPEDDKDPRARLEPISHFPGGDPAVVRKGMAILELLLLGGYDKDRSKDAASGEYNPLNAGVWNKEEITARLQAEAHSTKIPELDSLLDPGTGVRGYWD